jgi:hypothetical protein
MIAAPFSGTDAGSILMQLSVLAFVVSGLCIMIPSNATRKFGSRTLILGVVLAAFSSFAMGLFR